MDLGIKRMKKRMEIVTICVLMALTMAACTPNNGQGNDGKSQPAASTLANPPVPENQKEQWEIEWEKTIEFAKKEGEVVIYGPASNEREEVMLSFNSAYPEIKVIYTGMRQTESAAKIAAEQQQDKFLGDVYFESPPFYISPTAFEDIKNFIVLPELKEDKTWHNGYEASYEMVSNSGIFPFAVGTVPIIHINNDVIPEGEIQTYQDLLKPEYKGKIIMQNFAIPNQTEASLTALYLTEGEEFVKKLVEEQDAIFINSNPRQMLESFVLGKYPIAIGIDVTGLRSFTEQGAIKKVTALEPDKTSILSTRNVGVLSKPPHPNATKVFINWFLGKEAQTKFVEATKLYSSRRQDVPESPNVRPWSEIDYKISLHSEEGRKVSQWVLNYGKTIN